MPPRDATIRDRHLLGVMTQQPRGLRHTFKSALV
jgi:hypothetical protein